MDATEKLHFGPGVAAHIAAHGGALTLRRSPRHGCCGGTASIPIAETRPPQDAASFCVWEQEGATIYLEKPLVGTLPLALRLENLFGLKRLFIEGGRLQAGKSD